MTRIIRLKTVDSTNTYLKSLAAHGAAAGLVVIADEQTGGRGTHERSFESPRGGLYLSYLMKPKTAPEETASLTKWTAVSVRRAIERFCGIACDIKPVNDLLINGRKVCGILTELNCPNLVIGVGINVNSLISDFSDDVKPVVATLGTGLDIDCLAKLVISELDSQALDWPVNPWRMAEYENIVNP